MPVKAAPVPKAPNLRKPVIAPRGGTGTTAKAMGMAVNRARRQNQLGVGFGG